MEFIVRTEQVMDTFPADSAYQEPQVREALASGDNSVIADTIMDVTDMERSGMPEPGQHVTVMDDGERLWAGWLGRGRDDGRQPVSEAEHAEVTVALEHSEAARRELLELIEMTTGQESPIRKARVIQPADVTGITTGAPELQLLTAEDGRQLLVTVCEVVPGQESDAGA